jgi:hypothetical protein
MDIRIERQGTDFCFEYYLCHMRRESHKLEIHPDFTSTSLLHTNIGEARRVISDENNDKMGRTSSTKSRDPLLHGIEY